jgi:hypothetical protein
MVSERIFIAPAPPKKTFEDAGVTFDPGFPRESQTLVEDVPAEELSAEEQYELRRYLGECLPSGTPSSIILEEILMEDDVGGCLPDGTHSSIILEGAPMADGDDCNPLVSLEESYPSSYCYRTETLDPDRTYRSVDVSPHAWANYSPGVPVGPRSQRPCRFEGGHRSFRQCGSETAPADPDLVARGNASRIRSSFPPWIMRRVSRRSVYIPALDTRRQEQENCILRDRMHRRGEILQTDDETASPTFHVAASTATIRAIPNDCVAVLDIGASKSVVGLPAARRIHAAAGRSLDLVLSNRRFLFGYKLSASLGTCIVEVPTPGSVLELSVDIVDMDVPFLSGLDVMDKHRLQVLTVSNEPECVPSGYSLGW